MKNLTFAIGLAWLIYGALFFDYPDWDVGVSLVMACSTYLCADWAWEAIRKPLKWPLVAVAAWWCVDGSYTVYWSLVNPSVMIREGQWPMSLCLFLLCGAIWTIAPTLDRFRDNLQLIDQDLRGSRLAPLAPIVSLCLRWVAALQGNTVARRLLG